MSVNSKNTALGVTALLISMTLAACNEGGSSNGTSDLVTGRGGSTARMTISGDYLYAIANQDVQLFDISQPEAPNPWVRVPVAWDIETLFPYGDYLLIGAESGLHIMDNSDPASPRYVGDFQHARARDPVVAENDIAYVTLKAANSFDNTNELNVINISDVENPQLLAQIPMQGPSGLSIENNQLYVCDDVAGIKIFDTSDPNAVVVTDSIRNVNCNDIIATNELLYVITEDKLMQYDNSVSPPVLISEISEGES